MRHIHFEFSLNATNITANKLFKISEEILKDRIMEALDTYYNDESIVNFKMIEMVETDENKIFGPCDEYYDIYT